MLTNRKNLNIVTTVILLAVVIFGIWYIMYVGNKVDRTERANLLLRAQNISLLLNENDIANLSGSLADLQNPSYIRIKENLENIRALNADTRFIYLMGLSNGKQFFYADSEDPTSDDYSPPGQVYLDATELDLYNHAHGIAYTSGPTRDEWGTWITGSAPIVNKETGQTRTLVGMDVDARHLSAQIMKARLVALGIFLFVFCALLFLLRLIKKSVAYGDKLEKENLDLFSSHERLLEIEHAAGIGEISWTKTTDAVTIDQTIMDVLSIAHSKMTLEEFLQYLNPQDLERLKKEIELRKESTTPVTLRYHLKDTLQKEHSMTSICRIKTDSKGDVLGISCTAQDMTGIV